MHTGSYLFPCSPIERCCFKIKVQILHFNFLLKVKVESYMPKMQVKLNVSAVSVNKLINFLSIILDLKQKHI